jgi:hypothetical protein
MKQKFFGLLAVVIAVAALAFTTPHKTTGSWFLYDGTHSQSLTSSYTLSTQQPPACAETTRLCAIFIDDDVNGILSAQELQDALDEHGDGSTFPAPEDGFIKFKN